MFLFIANGLVLVTMLLLIYFQYAYLKEKGMKFTWWKWALSITWLVCVYITVAFIATAIGEGYPGAALRGGASFIALAVVTGVILYKFVFKLGFKKQGQS